MINAEVRDTVRGGRRMTDEELSAFLETIRYGTLSYVNDTGWPDMRPLNFGLYNGCYYFHTHKFRGEKLKDLTTGKKVCISLYNVSDKVGMEHICQHESVLVYGHLERLDEDDKYSEDLMKGLTAMCVAGGTAYKAAPDRIVTAGKRAGAFRVVPEYTVGKIVKFSTLPD